MPHKSQSLVGQFVVLICNSAITLLINGSTLREHEAQQESENILALGGLISFRYNKLKA